jgi:hypothetical protein
MAIPLLAPSPALAWGAAAHRYIMTRAIDLLPAELKPFFDKNRTEVVVRVIDPDTWRVVGWEDDPNHFVDFGLSELGPYPFEGLPRELDRAIEKFGLAGMKRIGLLPWRFEEMFGNLRRSFEGLSRHRAYAASDVVLFSSAAAHYIQDAHQPLHATNNHDGQLSGNTGIHSRFEGQLFERYESRLAVKPARPESMTNPRDAAFAALLAGHKLVDSILAADREAVGGKDVYDDDYYEKFFTKVHAVLEQGLADSITATAGLIVGAWEAAGKPAITLQEPRPVQRVRKRADDAAARKYPSIGPRIASTTIVRKVASGACRTALCRSQVLARVLRTAATRSQELKSHTVLTPAPPSANSDRLVVSPEL